MENKYKNYRKLAILIFATVLTLSQTYALPGNWQWANSAGCNTASTSGVSITTDLSGNVYVVGTFYTPSITIGSFTLLNSGLSDAFLAKYDNNGNLLWTKSLGVSSGTYSGISASAITTDASGNIYICGQFLGIALFDTYTLTANYGHEIFVVKYDQSGNAIWANQSTGYIAGWTGTNDRNASGIATDASGNVYITGQGNCQVTFGSITLTDYSSVFTGGSLGWIAYGHNIILVKFDTNGNVIWGKSAGGAAVLTATSTVALLAQESYAGGITIDPFGNIFISGNFNCPSITFGAYTLTNSLYEFYTNTKQQSDMFLVKYNNDGNVVWATSSDGNGNSYGNSVAADATGNVYLTGGSDGELLNFGAYTTTGKNNFFVKYDPSGNVIWLNEDISASIIISPSGKLYRAGAFSNTISIGSFDLTSSGGDDIVVLNYDPFGNVIDIYSAGGTGNDDPSSIATDASDNIYITGSYYSPSLSFGTNTINNVNPTYHDYFVAKYNKATRVETIKNRPSDISVSPNPLIGNDELTIAFSAYKFNTITIYNNFGESIYTSSISALETKKTINLKNIPDGVYYIKATGSDNYITKSFAINH